MRPLSRALFFLVVLIFAARPLHAQVEFFTTPPVIDSFPVVKFGISVGQNGKPAPIDKTNLKIKEDGVNITNFELIGCDESESASIALLVDVSGSMQVTLAYNGPRFFYDAFSKFVQNLYAPTELALIPFNDTVARIIPASYRKQDFFKAEDFNDTSEFIDSIGGLQFNGNTNVDRAIIAGAKHLRKANLPRKTIVLVTDDAIFDQAGLIKLLKDEGISLFVFELDNDTLPQNLATANETGGKLFSPSDSTQIPWMFGELARSIFTKKCTVRYVSNHPCPWWSEKLLWLGLSFSGNNLVDMHYFNLGSNKRDTVAPKLTATSPAANSRLIKAEEDFPCTRGIKTFTDSALVNFAKLSRFRKMPNLVYDSIVVIDESRSADGWYIATDSSGNAGRVQVHYEPPADIYKPQWASPMLVGSQYSASVTELNKWDRGLK